MFGMTANGEGRIFVLRLMSLVWVGLFWGMSVGCGGDGEPGGEGEAKSSIAKGKELFERNGCAVCHGEEGRGDGRIAETLKPPPRNFRDLTAYQQGTGVDEIARTIEKGVAGGGTMPAYAHLSPEERKLIAQYIVHLQAQP